jgi:hypothetical protein
MFVGEDKTLELEILDINLAPIDATSWTVVFDVRAKDNSEAILLTYTATILGTFNVSRTLNMQRAYVTILAADVGSATFKGSNLPTGAKTYRYSLARMNSGYKTVLCRGDFSPEKATGLS